jgi:hypothetical protein
MRGDIPPLPHYAFMAWCLVKAQEQLYFYLYFEVCCYILVGIKTDIEMVRQNDVFFCFIKIVIIYEGVSKSFRTESITKCTLTFGIIR